MIKPKKLIKGDTVAIVSLSNGMGGDQLFTHRVELGKERLEELGLNVIIMPNALKGSSFLYEHPEKRAEDLMNAFKNPLIKGIITIIGGSDTIRLLPYIDFEIIKNNPKMFMGYSDTTVNHFMMYHVGLISYYGPCVMCEFAENGQMHNYTKKYINEVLFENKNNIVIKSSPFWTSEFLDWRVKENNNIQRKMNKEMHGFEVLQGSGKFSGQLLGGCIDVFPIIIGTEIWPACDDFKGKILFLETSEEELAPNILCYYLRNLVAQGIVSNLSGIIVGKPKNETYYNEYKQVYKDVIGKEAHMPNLPILYNVNFGHASPICVLPIGINVEVNLNNKIIVFKEKAMED